ncbi:hypothetical protein KEM56_005922 [Ascosphaera pollenicola]|nr:hypothetical protein KEM56_005922 [Ascosphaera pollenicola]
MTAKANIKATHYMVLNLPGPSTSLSRSVLKTAYHKALLQHHPDKSREFQTAIQSPEEVKKQKHSAYSVDQITTAYKILADPVTRAEYDRELRLACVSTREPGEHAAAEDDSIFRIGLELYDLDDLQMEEGGGPDGSDIWYHACRCGEKKGFLVSESDLEREAEWGEIIGPLNPFTMSEAESKAASPPAAAAAAEVEPSSAVQEGAPAAAADSPAAAADGAAESAVDAKEHDAANGTEKSGVENGESVPKEESQNAAQDSASGNADSENGESKTSKAPVVVPQAESTDANGDNELTADEAAAATPAPKRSSSKRKSIGGNKGGNKRKSTNRTLHLDAKPGEYYIARLKSYPPWPSVICDEEMLPPALTARRPVTTKQPDGTYFEAYADNGKRVYERTFPIMFLGSNEFAWIPNTDITPITPEECAAAPEKGKTKGLIEAFKIASEGHDLEYFKKLINDHNAALQQEEEAYAAREAEKQRKAQEKAEKAAAKAATQKKGKRKSIAAAETEEEDDAEEPTEKKKPSKKRKKDAESDEEKPAKTPKTGMKLKLTTPKTPADKEEGAFTKKTAASSAKGGKAKGKKATEKKEAGEDSPKGEEKGKLSAGEMKEQAVKRKQLVLYLRHKLQKGFLTRDQAPKEDEMPSMSQYIQRLESFKDLEVSIIRETKINKVLKGIVKLNTIPRDEEFRFRERSMSLLSFWRQPLAEAEAEAEATKRKDEPKDETKDKKELHKEDSLLASTPAPPDGEEEKKEKEEKTPEPTSATDKEDAKEKPSSPPSVPEDEKKASANETPADGDVEMTDAGAEEEKKDEDKSLKEDKAEKAEENEKQEEGEKKEDASEEGKEEVTEKKADDDSKTEEKETEKREEKKDEAANADDS